jgi:hypothetical protein
MDVTDDLELRRRAIDDARADLARPDDVIDPVVDPVVVASWQRSAAGVADDLGSAPVGETDEARDRWEASALSRPVLGLVTELDHIATTSDLIACVSDPDGRVLWQSTPRWLRSGSERIGLLPGGVWHEGLTGTNGIGLALAADRPTAVFASEHWMEPVRDWVCYAAPIHGSDGNQIGAVNLSTTWKHANPLALTTVASLARLVEHELLAARAAVQPSGPALDLHILGEPQAFLGGRPVRLTQRQFEILTILAVNGPVSLGELHAHLYGDRPVAIATLKAEMSRLRQALGGQLTSRPYRLTLPWRVDAVELLEDLARGDVQGAAGRYNGQVLPASEAPFVADHRHHVDVALRTALMRVGGAAGVLRYTAVHPYDIEVLERGHVLTPADDPLVPALTARLAVATSA